jgi:hypothetical protein
MRKRHTEPSYDVDLDHICIAEMVIFQVRGEDVRHLGRLPAEEGSHP